MSELCEAIDSANVGGHRHTADKARRYLLLFSSTGLPDHVLNRKVRSALSTCDWREVHEHLFWWR